MDTYYCYALQEKVAALIGVGRERYAHDWVLATRGNFPARRGAMRDMGTWPDFKALRVFSTVQGRVARFTGDDSAVRFPDLDQCVRPFA